MTIGFLGSFALALMAGACSPGTAQLTSPASPETQAAPRPTASPTPPLPAHIQDLELIALDRPGSWRVIGLLASDSSVSHSGISIEVSLLGGEGEVVSGQVVSPLFPDLLGQDTVPFKADFQAGTEVERVVAAPLGYRLATVERAQVEAKVTRAFSGEDGQTRVLGELVSSGSTAAVVSGLAVVARNPEGRIVDLSSRVISLAGMSPSGRAPFLALVEFAPLGFDFQAFAEAIHTAEAESGRLAFEQAPSLVIHARRAPFLLGSLRNHGAKAQWVRGIVSFKYRGEIVTLGEIRSPVPLAGGEALAFSVEDLPGLLTLVRGDPQAAAQIEILPEVDWAGSLDPAPPPIPLPITIDAYEAVGETLILRGVVANPTPGPVSSATVFAAVRTLKGGLVAAGWLEAVDVLKSGARTDVVLTLRLAEDVDPTDMEFDIRAFGVGP